MKRLNTPFFILLFSSLLLAACQDQSVQNDQFQSPPLQNSLTSSSSDNNWTERVQEGRILADKEMNGYSRWDSPWWELDHYSLSDSIKAVKGHVLIGFKNPEDVSGVDLTPMKPLNLWTMFKMVVIAPHLKYVLTK